MRTTLLAIVICSLGTVHTCATRTHHGLTFNERWAFASDLPAAEDIEMAQALGEWRHVQRPWSCDFDRATLHPDHCPPRGI